MNPDEANQSTTRRRIWSLLPENMVAQDKGRDCAILGVMQSPSIPPISSTGVTVMETWQSDSAQKYCETNDSLALVISGDQHHPWVGVLPSDRARVLPDASYKSHLRLFELSNKGFKLLISREDMSKRNDASSYHCGHVHVLHT